MHVASLAVFPVKSTRALAVSTSAVHPQGLAHDRRWALVRPDGSVITARRCDRLLRISATPTEHGIRLAAPGVPDVEVTFPRAGEWVDVDVSRMPRARATGDDVREWCTRVVGEPARLVWQEDPADRSVSAAHGGGPSDPLSLADAAPLLVATTASLRRLNEWIAESDPDAVVPMSRFRPNVVVDGSREPFEEDRWRRVRIGPVVYRFAEQCDRCVLTTIDPDTLRHGKEPLRTLARQRKRAGKTWFAVRMIPETPGTISVGDPVDVLERLRPDGA